MAEVHVIMGLPLAGKTTYADRSSNLPENACVIELSDYTSMTPHGPRMTKEGWKLAYADMRDAIANDESIVIDGNNTMPTSRKEMLDTTKAYGATRTTLHIMCTPMSVCIKRGNITTPEQRKAFMKMMRHQVDLFIGSLADIPNEGWDCVRFIHHNAPQEV